MTLLRENESLLSALVEHAPTGMSVVGDQFRMLQINARARPAFATIQPLLGRDFSEVVRILWGPELGAQIDSIFRHTLPTGERYVSPPFSGHRHDIDTDQAYDGETQRVTLPGGQHGVVCYFSDITQRKRMESELIGVMAEAKKPASRNPDFCRACAMICARRSVPFSVLPNSSNPVHHHRRPPRSAVSIRFSRRGGICWT